MSSSWQRNKGRSTVQMQRKAADHLNEPAIVGKERACQLWAVWRVAGQTDCLYSYLRDHTIPKPHHLANVLSGFPISPSVHQARRHSKAFHLSPYHLPYCERLPILQVQTKPKAKQHKVLGKKVPYTTLKYSWVCSSEETLKYFMYNSTTKDFPFNVGILCKIWELNHPIKSWGTLFKSVLCSIVYTIKKWYQTVPYIVTWVGQLSMHLLVF